MRRTPLLLDSLSEADFGHRRLGRAAASGGPDDIERHRRALIRLGPSGHAELISAGHSGDVMAHHVREHADASAAYNKVTSSKPMHRHDLEKASLRLRQAQWAIRTHHKEHGDHPADHAKREKNETQRQFGDRLRGFSLTNSTIYPPSGATDKAHGMISYAHDDDDKDGHIKSRKAMKRAWEREVPDGHAVEHNKTYGDGTVKGSVVSFNSGPRPRPRRNRR